MIHLERFTDKTVEDTYNDLKKNVKFAYDSIEYRAGYIGSAIPGMAAERIYNKGTRALYDFARDNICYMEKAFKNVVTNAESYSDYKYYELCADAKWLYNLDIIHENITDILCFRALFYCKEKKFDINERQMNLIFDIDMKKIQYFEDLFDKVEKIAKGQVEVACQVD